MVTKIAKVPISLQQLRNKKDRRNKTLRLQGRPENDAMVRKTIEGFTEFNQHKELAAELFQYDSITELQYELVEGRDEKEGMFVARMQRVQEEIVLGKHWVVTHFKKDVVVAVMKRAIQGSFLDVECEEIILADKWQVQKLRWVIPMDDPKCKKNKGPCFEATFGDGS